VPGDQVLVRARVVGDARSGCIGVRVAVGTLRGDAEVVGAGLRARRGQPLAEDLELVVDERQRVVVALPDDRYSFAVGLAATLGAPAS
jgi:hypothetical protein